MLVGSHFQRCSAGDCRKEEEEGRIQISCDSDVGGAVHGDREEAEEIEGGACADRGELSC